MKRLHAVWILLFALALPTYALAHPGHEHGHAAGFAEGLAHPITGADHLAIAGVLAAIAWLGVRFSERRGAGVAVGAGILGIAHAAVHAVYHAASPAYAAGVVTATAAVYAAAAAAGIALARSAPISARSR